MDPPFPPSLVTFDPGSGPPRAGLLAAGRVLDLERATALLGPAAPEGLRGRVHLFLLLARSLCRAEILESLLDGLRRRDALGDVEVPGARLLLTHRPGKVVAVGRNYAAHARELGNAPPEAPFFFLKAPSTAVGPGEPIVLPSDVQGEVHHEAELAVIVGQRCRRVDAVRAAQCIAAYTCANDVTARTEQRALQDARLPWFGGKNADTFLALGPGLVPADSVADPAALRVQCFVDGVRRQDGATADMVHGVAALLSHVSRRLTLEPGDVLLTGTPAGVGPLVAGNRVEVRIPGVGSLENPVAAETA